MKEDKVVGIYAIQNQENGNLYIGSSKWIRKRWDQHRSYLRHNKGTNKHFQNAWNLYGADKFNWFVLEECPEDQLVVREQFYMDEAKWEGWPLYNELEADRHNPWNKGKRGCYSPEVLEKMRKAKEFVSPETREKMRLQKIGRPLTDEHKKKLGSGWRGKKRPPFSEDWRRKLSLVRMGKMPWNKGKRWKQKCPKGHLKDPTVTHCRECHKLRSRLRRSK